MQLGYMMMLPNLHETLSDAEMVRNELRVAAMAEEIGYDVIWCPEHHFDAYSMSPDNLQILSYLAAKTRKIKLGSAAIILPWWSQPSRVAAKITTMDAMTDGRYLCGFGRGLARREFEAFGISMEESRARFDEAAAQIIRALSTGYIEGDGPYFPQKRTEIRPRPSQDLKDRLYSVAMSPESAKQIALNDTRMMTFVQFSMEKHLPNIEIFRAEYRKNHAKTPPPPLLIDFSYCHEDAGKAEQMAQKYLSANYLSILQHYEFMSDHLAQIKGYTAYGEASKFLNSLGLDAAVADYVSHQAWGTPQQILDRLEKRRQVIGEYEWNSIVSFAGMPYDEVEKSMRLIGSKVLPELRSW
jgi:alkanesulfonate monooxygenase SsuD/methylene tetrahydromethanopterin reductase-like flavin-dependent oxidoreductase (luciferase family)